MVGQFLRSRIQLQLHTIREEPFSVSDDHGQTRLRWYPAPAMEAKGVSPILTVTDIAGTFV